MAGGTPPRITFESCREEEDCATAFFLMEAAGPPQRVEVRTTAQIEHLLAHQLGKEALDLREREAILRVAGLRLIERELQKRGGIRGPLLLDSEIFRHHGEERRLLREAGLLSGLPGPRQP